MPFKINILVSIYYDFFVWSKQGSCTWSSMSGRKVQLRPVSILNLTEAERLALQKIALSKLQSMDIGCPVAIPKGNDPVFFFTLFMTTFSSCKEKQKKPNKSV